MIVGQAKGVELLHIPGDVVLTLVYSDAGAGGEVASARAARATRGPVAEPEAAAVNAADTR